MNRMKWLVFGYSLPAEPTRARVSVWRRLKKLGAVNVKQCLWFLPYSDDSRAQLQAASEYIRANGGTGVLLESTAVDDESKNAIIRLLNRAREAEYAELVAECSKYVARIEQRISTRETTEEESVLAELERLTSWHQAIVARDLFSCPARPDADSIIARAANAAHAATGFSGLVSRNNGDPNVVAQREQTGEGE